MIRRQKRIFTSVRPPRVAVFLREDDAYWQSTCTRIIEFFSAAWGGGYNIIVPMDGKTLKQPFWDILDVYDPDYLFLYNYSGHDIKLNEPERYVQWLDKNLDEYLSGVAVSDVAVSDVDAARRQIDEGLRDAPLFAEPETALQQNLIKALAPFHINEHAFEGYIGVGSNPGFPLAPLIKLLPNIEHSKRIASYEPQYAGLYPLWLASTTGALNEVFNRELNAIGVQAETIRTDEYGPADLLIAGPEAAMIRRQRQVVTPFELANIDTGLYQPVKGMAEPTPVILVVGETLPDFCLYYSLSRLSHPVVWLPMNFLATQQEAGTERVMLHSYVDHLKSSIQIRQRQRVPRYVVVSASADDAALNSTVHSLDEAGYNRFERVRDSVAVAPAIRTLLRRPLRLYEADNVYRPSSLTVPENAQFDFFETPKPKNLLRIDPYENRWISEINIQAHKLPRNPHLGEWIIRHGMLATNGARVSKSGLAYFCPSAAYFDGDIDTTLVRPSIFIPDALQMFEHLFRRNGYDAAVSDKGFFARDTTERFGTLAALAALLRPDPMRAMLLKFLDHIKPAQGIRDEGSVLNDKRRYLNLPSISKFLGNGEASQKTIDLLIRAKVLHRGFIFKCQFCKSADWFSVDEVSENFKCKRCGRTQWVSAENYWYADYEPGWFYKLDEIVYQFLRHNGYVTLLALDYFERKAEESFLYAPDVELKKQGSSDVSMELDILCVPDGVSIIGEAKKENRLGRNKRTEVETIRRYSSLADQIGAEKLVFATFADRWSDNTETHIRDNVNARDVILLTRTELLAD